MPALSQVPEFEQSSHPVTWALLTQQLPCHVRQSLLPTFNLCWLRYTQRSQERLPLGMGTFCHSGYAKRILDSSWILRDFMDQDVMTSETRVDNPITWRTLSSWSLLHNRNQAYTKKKKHEERNYVSPGSALVSAIPPVLDFHGCLLLYWFPVFTWLQWGAQVPWPHTHPHDGIWHYTPKQQNKLPRIKTLKTQARNKPFLPWLASMVRFTSQWYEPH